MLAQLYNLIHKTPMPRNNKRFINQTVIEVTFRTEEGLPLPPKPYIQEILLGILAKAQQLYPVRICSIVVMSNHIHLIFVVLNPGDIYEFVGYIKRESAHAINNLLGRNQHTVWQQGYDSPCIASAEAVMNRLAYHYTNPQRAGLVEKIEDYPNINTWEALNSGVQRIPAKRIHRYSIPELPKFTVSLNREEEIAQELRESSSEDLELVIEPNAWMDCFEESKGSDPKTLNAEIVNRVRAIEKNLTANRPRGVLGAHKLKLQRIDTPHTPKKSGKKMIVIDTIRARCKAYIKWFKVDQEQARESRKRRDRCESSVPLPPGFFLPGGALLANIMFWCTPLAESFG